MPGPLFTFAAYLGAAVQPAPNGIAGAVIGLVGIFLPGLLALIGTLPFWAEFRRHDAAQAALRGIHAGPLCNSVVAEALTSVLITINQRYKIPGAGIRITGLPE